MDVVNGKYQVQEMYTYLGYMGMNMNGLKDTKYILVLAPGFWDAF